MKYVALLLILVCAVAFGQTASLPQNIYAGGISYNQTATPHIAGTALYARLINDGSGTYAFAVYDALPAAVKPFTVTSNVGGGVAQKLFTIGKVPVFVPVSGSVSFNGTNTGWAWSGGAMASMHLKGNWRVFPNVRFLKSSVSNGSGYQPIVGLMFGWGQ